MRKYIFVLVLLLCTSFAYTQQIGEGYARTIDSFNNILTTGVYESDKIQTSYPYEVPHWPWKYLFVMRHNNPGLNYQFQISSTFEHNDRVFFRKLCHLNADTIYNNEWHEFATRGVNVFTETQYLRKNLSLSVGNSVFFGDGSNPDRCFKISYYGDEQRGDSYIDYSENLYFRSGTQNGGFPVIKFDKYGNVGIGMTDTPQNKLDVNGTIRAKEIKVESGWADFVFKEDYKLPSLDEVRKHIDEKGTLPGVPSEKEIKENGMKVGETNALLLQKIEELTLYILDLKQEIDDLKKEKN